MKKFIFDYLILPVDKNLLPSHDLSEGVQWLL